MAIKTPKTRKGAFINTAVRSLQNPQLVIFISEELVNELCIRENEGSTLAGADTLSLEMLRGFIDQELELRAAK